MTLTCCEHRCNGSNLGLFVLFVSIRQQVEYKVACLVHRGGKDGFLFFVFKPKTSKGRIFGFFCGFG